MSTLTIKPNNWHLAAAFQLLFPCQGRKILGKNDAVTPSSGSLKKNITDPKRTLLKEAYAGLLARPRFSPESWIGF